MQLKAGAACRASFGLPGKAAGKEPGKRYHDRPLGDAVTKLFKTLRKLAFTELIEELEKRTGHKVIGNRKSASGTEILDELAEEEIATGHMGLFIPLVDSVLQICGNEERLWAG